MFEKRFLLAFVIFIAGRLACCFFFFFSLLFLSKRIQVACAHRIHTFLLNNVSLAMNPHSSESRALSCISRRVIKPLIYTFLLISTSHTHKPNTCNLLRLLPSFPNNFFPPLYCISYVYTFFFFCYFFVLFYFRCISFELRHFYLAY